MGFVAWAIYCCTTNEFFTDQIIIPFIIATYLFLFSVVRPIMRHRKWSVENLLIFISLLLFMLVIPAFSFFISPLFTRLSRQHEFEADAYAAAHASAAELGSALVKLYKDNASTLTPDPLHSAFYDSHPPAAIRIARLRTV